MAAPAGVTESNITPRDTDCESIVSASCWAVLDSDAKRAKKDEVRRYCTSMNGCTNNLRFSIKYFTSLDISFIIWDEYNLWVPIVRRTRFV